MKKNKVLSYNVNIASSKTRFFWYSFLTLLIISMSANAQELYKMPKDVNSRWFSFENSTGEKGLGGKENKGAKGHAFSSLKAGDTATLLETKGSGIIQRMWMTISDRSPEMLRSLRLEMYWDGEEKPAVSVPLGDFFGVGLGKRVPFESSLFSDPEGRSFNCFIPMPFKKGAKVIIINDSDKDLVHLFYDINMVKTNEMAEDLLYFHTYWNREKLTNFDKDFSILPKVKGTGRFLGTNIGVLANPIYGESWWGEGEVKMYLDGDGKYPTLVGTGTEDYVGTAFGQGVYNHQYQGSLIIDKKTGEFAFYRYHIPDPIYFYNDIQVAIQQIGGGPKEQVAELVANHAPLKIISVDSDGDFKKILDMENPPKINEDNFPDGWTNFYRQDDVSATAYFYLNSPSSNLPKIQPLKERTDNLIEVKE